MLPPPPPLGGCYGYMLWRVISGRVIMFNIIHFVFANISGKNLLYLLLLLLLLQPHWGIAFLHLYRYMVCDNRYIEKIFLLYVLLYVLNIYLRLKNLCYTLNIYKYFFYCATLNDVQDYFSVNSQMNYKIIFH